MVNEAITEYNYLNRKYDGWKFVEKTITFVGGTSNAIGDYDGTSNPFDVFSVTGMALVKIIAVVSTTLVGSTSTLALGVTANTAGVIAETIGTALVANEIWHDADPDAFLEASTVLAEKISTQDIIGWVTTANITAGAIKFICLWKPLTDNGKVEAA